MLGRDKREKEAIAKLVRAGATSIVIARGRKATVIRGYLQNGTERTVTVGKDNVIPFSRSHRAGFGRRLVRFLREHISITL